MSSHNSCCSANFCIGNIVRQGCHRHSPQNKCKAIHCVELQKQHRQNSFENCYSQHILQRHTTNNLTAQDNCRSTMMDSCSKAEYGSKLDYCHILRRLCKHLLLQKCIQSILFLWHRVGIQTVFKRIIIIKVIKLYLAWTVIPIARRTGARGQQT